MNKCMTERFDSLPTDPRPHPSAAEAFLVLDGSEGLGSSDLWLFTTGSF